MSSHSTRDRPAVYLGQMPCFLTAWCWSPRSPCLTRSWNQPGLTDSQPNVDLWAPHLPKDLLYMDGGLLIGFQANLSILSPLKTCKISTPKIGDPAKLSTRAFEALSKRTDWFFPTNPTCAKQSHQLKLKCPGHSFQDALVLSKTTKRQTQKTWESKLTAQSEVSNGHPVLG